MNEFQILTLSGSLAVFGITWLFFGFGNDDDDDGERIRAVCQDAD